MNLNEILWGDDSAEKDRFLLEYFVDSPAFSRLRSKAKSIVVGRKGSGKSALRKKLEQEFCMDSNTYVVNITPKFNAIRNVLNDEQINRNFGEEIFFQHTWLRQIYLDFLCKIGDSARGRYVENSLEFARQITLQLNRTSKDLVENIVDVLTKIRTKAGSIGELGIQVERELRNIAEVEALEYHAISLAESGANFVALIDDLDLGWDNSRIANNLLLGLLSAATHLSSKSGNFHVIVFLREDVYSLLISQTQHSDKYRNVERIRWEKADLIRILETRINFNRRQHGLEAINPAFQSVFPNAVGTTYAGNWLVERTLNRPRELIQLARYYTESVNGLEPSADLLKQSEANYSSWKLDDLCSEYSNQYPDMIQIFTYWRTKYFRHKYHLSGKEIRDMVFQIMEDVEVNKEWFNKLVSDVDVETFLKILYEIGFIGDFVLGGEGGSKTFYSYDERHEPKFDEVQIHSCFRKAANTVERIRGKKDGFSGEE